MNDLVNGMEKLRQIEDEMLNLKESPFYDNRIKNKERPVAGEGHPRAHIMFIGEAPGQRRGRNRSTIPRGSRKNSRSLV